MGIVSKLQANIYRTIVIVLLIVGAAKGGWDFYWWNQWLKQVSYQQQQIVKFLVEPVGQAQGKPFNRADLLTAIAQQNSKPSPEKSK